jgi:hypothetical protein
MRAGAGRGHRHAFMLTLGTGVGGAAVSDGHLIRGAHGIATEIGELVRIDCPCRARSFHFDFHDEIMFRCAGTQQRTLPLTLL